jgi:hypothetical protein
MVQEVAFPDNTPDFYSKVWFNTPELAPAQTT